jgi:triacylglycerol lipase
MKRTALVMALLAFAAALVPLPHGGAAGAQDEPGPALESDPVVLETSLDCPEGLHRPEHPVVLLVHGTATTAAESWPSGLGRVLTAGGYDWCMVQLPARALVDIQQSAEHVVAAVRTLHRRTGRMVSIVGHSQGALQPRWAIRWWPDVRAAVDDLIMIAGANREIPWTKAAFCNPSCAPPIWQFSLGASFMRALNRVPMPAGPSYTTIRSLTDNLIQPASPEATAVATIDGATNIAVQDLCAGRVVEHVGLIFDAVAIDLVLDALSHTGPAEPARVGTRHCADVYASDINPVVAGAAIAALYANAFPAVPTGPQVAAEPPQRAFAETT